MHTLVYKLDNNLKWWSMYACLLGFFYFFSSPFYGKTIQPSYSNFSRWYVAWLLVAACYHLPSFQSMGVDIKMNLSLFLTLFLSSVTALILFHITFLGLWYFGLAARLAGKRPEILIILQNSAVLSIACCVFYSHCGNRAPSFARQRSSQFIFDYLKNSKKAWLWGWPTMQEAKEQICTTWLGPVGSANDYPFFSKWVLYGELACNEGCDGTANISPVYSLWATFIGLYIANYVVERSTGWALTHPTSTTDAKEKSPTSNTPMFLDMVPWYSGTSADLFKTAFDLLVSVTLFLGRFDMRTMQAAMAKAQACGKKDDFLYNHLSQREELWFDFMADTGDGGNPTYTVARLLAKPLLNVDMDGKRKFLPRGDLLLIGGDLAYPNPSPYSYENRLFRPFEYALQPPDFYNPAHIAVKKPELPKGVKSLDTYEGPQCFAIPGNHDWLDGLEIFVRYICHKSWLGGWLLPQKKSYFALQLPQGWWVFGLDQALHADIDILQFRYFSELVRKQVKKKDSVIIMTHEPSWLLDWYWDISTGPNVSNLIQDVLKGRCRIRVAGDLHHYFHHSVVNKSSKNGSIEHLLVNGCAGAFLHPTHVFAKFNQFLGSSYEKKAVYPSFEDSQRIALGNILKFRKKNWRFDVIGGIVYFVLAFSSFPQCDLENILQDTNSTGRFQGFFHALWMAISNMMEYSYISLGGTLVLLVIAYFFVPSKISRKRRLFLGLVHVIAHLAAAMILMLLLEIGVEICIRHGLLGTAGYHTLYEWYRSVENEHFPDPTGLKARIQFWSLGLYPACIKYLMSAFDVPEVIAVTRINICKNGMTALPRAYALVYYVGVFFYYWVLSTPVVSLVFGCYLYICINWFNLHFDEAFSSLRISNYKSFTRFHVNKAGNLEVYTIAVDKVPREWVLDPQWEEEQLSKTNIPSYEREYPSTWAPQWPFPDPNYNARVVDHFVIDRL
ncbi:hypothetical protein KP509_09G046200 [Ceratopteris richardii]|nr:hypothetical protein KP509_09G046200 [Ceratopteris richardii]